MNVKDALHKLKLEISENENRKDFSFSEKMKWAEELKKEYGRLARENMSEGGSSGNISTPLGKVRDKVAKDLDLGSGRNYDKAQYIYKNASEDIIQQLDEGELSINKVYNKLKEELKNKEDENNKLKYELEREKNNIKTKEVAVEIDNTDYSAVNKLKRIEMELSDLIADTT